MKPDPLDNAAALSLPRLFPSVREPDGTSVTDDDAAVAVGAPYQATAVGLIRLAYVILGDRQAAEDVVQDAFCNLFQPLGPSLAR
jgi:hypothetical protein